MYWKDTLVEQASKQTTSHRNKESQGHGVTESSPFIANVTEDF